MKNKVLLMSFGLYENMPLTYIVEHDAKYAAWIVKTSLLKKNKRVRVIREGFLKLLEAYQPNKTTYKL